MPIGTNTFANLGNLIKAATSGLLQTVTGNKNNVKDAQTETRVGEFPETGADQETGRAGTRTDGAIHDQVALSQEAQQESAKVQDQSVPLQTELPQQKPQDEASLVRGKQESSPIARSSELEPPQPQQGVEFAQEIPRETPQAGAAQQGKPAAELQQLLQAWLQLDPKTITGLERFLEVEFSHYPEDYQIFLNMRMMNMLKQARRLIEEQKLGSSDGDQNATETPEGAKRAMIGAAFMGYAYYKVLRKRARIQDRFGFGEKGILRGADGGPLTPFASLQEAERFLKEAEKELQRAMLQGLDNDRIRQLAGKVMDICAQIAEMQIDGGITGDRRRTKQQIA